MAAVGDKYGPYTCVRRIGEGGMAETFLALQSGPHGFEQRVCIKIIREDCKALPKFVEAFIAEATIAASLRHSNIVSVIDASQQDGYMVLELVDGVDLRTLAQALPARRLASDLVAYLALELVKALDFAHNRRLHGKIDGIVHRDVKPSNVLISYAGEVKLADFGIARAIRSRGDSDGLVRGTPCYMSPEQVESKPLDPRSDLFSLGILLYEVLAGRRPFDGQSDLDTVRKICQGELEPLAEAAPDAPAGLAAVVERLLRPDPDRRFASARELGDALDRFAPPPSTYRRLGALAREAQPPETVVQPGETGALALSVPVSEMASPTQKEAGSPGELPASGAEQQANDRAPLPDTVSLVGPGSESAEGAEASEKIAVPFSASAARGASPPASPNRRASLLMAAAAAVAVFALVFAIAGPRSEPAASGDSTPVAIEPSPPGDRDRVAQVYQEEPASPVPAPASESAEVALSSPSSSASSPAEQPPSDTPQPAPAEHGATAESVPAPAAPPEEPPGPHGRRSAAEKSPARVTVGVFPWGNVWIDGKARGKAPVRADLPAGRHSVAGGVESPEVTETVRLKRGFTTQVVINLGAKTFKATQRSAGR